MGKSKKSGPTEQDINEARTVANDCIKRFEESFRNTNLPSLEEIDDIREVYPQDGYCMAEQVLRDLKIRDRAAKLKKDLPDFTEVAKKVKILKDKLKKAGPLQVTNDDDEDDDEENEFKDPSNIFD